jgi:dCMP deaminase
VTLSPCKMCAKALVNAGISTVKYTQEYRNTEGVDILKSAGIEVIKLDSS